MVASVDTYLRFADAVNRLNIAEQDPKADLPEVVGGVTDKVVKGVAKHKTTGALDSAGEKLSNPLTGGQPERRKSPQRRSRRSTS